jgi:4-hydroxybenzoate polyprenyltransferase
VALCYGLAVALVAAALAAAGAGLLAYLGAAAFAAHLACQVGTFEPRDGDRALRLFRSNRDAGLVLFTGLTLDALLRAWA